MIDLVLDGEQRALVDSVKSFLAAESREPADRASDGFWRRCADLGLLGVAVPESRGGGGGGLIEQALVLREVGRALAPGPWLGTVVAALVVPDDALAARLVAGEARAVVGQADDAIARLVVFDDGDAGLALVMTGDDVRIGERSSLLLEEPRRTVDPACRVRIGELPSVTDGWGSRVASAAEVAAVGRVCAAAMLCGIAERTSVSSVEYVSTREQYGRPVGSFQAVKHRCADMAVRALAAWNLTAVAALRIDASQSTALQTASAAKAVAADAAVRNAADNVQNHGAIGFTDEHDAHRAVKRSAILEHLFGTPRALVGALTGPERMW